MSLKAVSALLLKLTLFGARPDSRKLEPCLILIFYVKVKKLAACCLRSQHFTMKLIRISGGFAKDNFSASLGNRSLKNCLCEPV